MCSLWIRQIQDEGLLFPGSRRRWIVLCRPHRVGYVSARCGGVVFECRVWKELVQGQTPAEPLWYTRSTHQVEKTSKQHAADGLLDNWWTNWALCLRYQHGRVPLGACCVCIVIPHTSRQTFVLRLQRNEVCCNFGLIFIKFSCTLLVRMRGWQYVETCFVSPYPLYSFWMSALASTTGAGDEIRRSKKLISAEPCKLWKELLHRFRAQLNWSVSAAFCGCVHSVAPIFLSFCLSSWPWHWKRPPLPFDLLVGGSAPVSTSSFEYFLILLLLAWRN